MEEFEKLDAHVHLGPSGEWLPYLDPSVSADSVVEAMDQADIQKAIVFPNPDTGDRYPELNQKIIEAVDRYPERLIGFGRVDPRRGEEAIEEVKRCKEEGLKGIKLHPFVETFRPDHPHFHNLFDCIYEEDLIILSHTGDNFASPGHMSKILEGREDMKIILGHLNEGGISVVGDHKNVYIDTSGARVYLLEHAAEKIPEKIVFGSDHPYLDYEVQKMIVKSADIGRGVKEDIFKNNLQKLLDT